MRGHLWALGVGLLLVSGVSHVPLVQAELAATNPSSASATLEVKKLKVNGMTCFGCVQAVQATLQHVAGVRRAEVSLETSEALVEYDPSQTTPDVLVAAVTEAGFEAELKGADETGLITESAQ